MLSLLISYSKAKEVSPGKVPRQLEEPFLATFNNWHQQLSRLLTACPDLQVCPLAKKGDLEKANKLLYSKTILFSRETNAGGLLNTEGHLCFYNLPINNVGK